MAETKETPKDGIDMNFVEEVASQPGGENIRRCFACGTCAAGCPVTDVDDTYNSRKIIRQILFGMRDEVLSSPQIWLCLVCYRCYARCPQKVNFTDIMRALRYLAVREKKVPAELRELVLDADRLTQEVHRDLIYSAFDKDDSKYKQVKAKIGSSLKETKNA
jgi:heterodisulfide reductase subunit C